ncbi:MAG: ECF-type sigma factor, partial [Planctomycetota bacterium]
AAMNRETPEVVVALAKALEKLSVQNERAARVIELRSYFGLTIEEIAETLDVSKRTVQRDWEHAKGALFEEIKRMMDEE